MNRFHILSTKKLKPSVLEKLEESNIEIIEKEFISIKPIVDKELHQQIAAFASRGVQTIALTSKNAVEVLNLCMHTADTYFTINWNIFCLSGATRQAVLDAPLLDSNIAGEADNAAELAKKIIAKDVREIIFFCGNKRRDELPDLLGKAGVSVHEVVLYETLETPVVITSKLDGILFFSPSAAESFFSVNQLSDHTVCFAIGNTTAEAIRRFVRNKIITSESPGQEMMLSTVQFYFQNINCYE
jgi:uroporphyrinogen-III synthase